MKKILIAALSITLLIGACDNQSTKESKNSNKNESVSKSKTNKKEEKQYRKELRQFLSTDLANYETMSNYIESVEEDIDPDNIITAYRQYADEFKRSLKEHKKKTKNMNVNNKDKIVNDFFVEFNLSFTSMLNGSSDLIEKLQNEEITEDEFNEKLDNLQSTLESRLDKADKNSEDISDEEIIKIIGKDLFNEYERVLNKFSEEDVSEEASSSANNDTDSDDTTSSMYTEDDFKEVKSEDITYTQPVGNLNVNFKEMKTYKVKVTEENEYNFENYSTGDTAYVLGIELELENTSETPSEYFIDQAEIVTNNQEQIEPSLITPKKLIKTELKGKVKSSGMIYYELETSTADNIEWLDFILPEMFDDESMDITFEEKKLRLEF